RPVLAPSKGFAGTDRQHQLEEARMGAKTLDLGYRVLRRLVGDHEACAQARLGLDPLGDQPIVDRRGQGGGVVVIELLPGPQQRLQDAEIHVPLVEQLVTHEVEIRSWWQAVLWPRVGARRVRVGARIVRTGGAAIANGVSMATPPL